MPHPTPDLLALQDAVAGRYSIERELGRGGMGVVFLARDGSLERPVAIKLLLPHLAHDSALRERFLREARTAAQLLHPNIVPIYAVETTAELSYFVMAYVEGETLAERIRTKGKLSFEQALPLMRDVAWALAHAHQRGVVHRDIKPDNILLEHATGRALVADFGIARVQAQETLTEAGAFLGTVQYMSPEQASAEEVDGRSDVYSLAATMYFALTGESPVEAPSLPAMLRRLMTEEGPRLSLVRPDLPSPFADLLGRSMARHRDARVGSAEELASALRELDRHSPALRPELRAFLRGMHTYAPLPFLVWFASLGAFGLADMGVIGTSGVVAGMTVALGAVAVFLAGLDASLNALRRDNVSLDAVLGAVEQETVEVAESIRRAGPPPITKLRPPARMAFGALYIGIGAAAAAVTVPEFVARHSWFLASISGAFSAIFAAAGIAIMRGPDAATRAVNWIAKSGSGGGVLGIVGWLLRRTFVQRLYGQPDRVSAPPVSSAIPTATLLVHRVEELIAQLPEDVRRRLPDILPAAAGLERVCATLRARVAKLDAAAAELPAASPARSDFTTARDRAAARLADGLTALETLRTDLLRLSVGLGQLDGLTLALESAKELSAAIDAELHGQSEVKKLLG